MSDKKQSDTEQHEEHSKICKVWLRIKRWWLPIAILLITSIGLVCALSIPQTVFQTPSNLNDRDTSTSQNPGTPDNKETSHSNSDNRNAPVLLAQSNLRLAFLYITGGAIAVMGLVETFRKNNNDKLKNDQEKQKNDREHLRQVRADRRERYTKAVEQLGDEKAPIRMGGVYTLVGLIDEWLEDESIEKYEDRLKEGQVIINNLCAYIRSPFTLASHYDELKQDTPGAEGVYQDKVQEFYADKATLDSEADVRLSIIKEIHDRIQGPDKNTPGAWSDFEYDFSGSTFFYPIDLTNSYYAKPINFSDSTYQGGAYFTGSTYWGRADFGGSIYQSRADFGDSTYHGRADFSDSTYWGRADFGDSIYQSRAYFSDSTYQEEADFTGSTYQGRADFGGSIYQSRAYFGGSTYRGRAYFGGSTYQSEADFSGSIFCSEIYFGYSKYHDISSRFTGCAPQFYNEKNCKNTLFGSLDNNFTVENGRGYPIYRTLEGLPLGCKFLTPEQKEYLEDKLQEIEKINDNLFEVKDLKEKEELSKKLQALNEELHKWRKEVTMVKPENKAAEDTES